MNTVNKREMDTYTNVKINSSKEIDRWTRGKQETYIIP